MALIEPSEDTRSLAETLDRHTVEGALWRPENGRVRCFACGHQCLIPVARRGICKVRYNEDGRLRVPFGYVAGIQADPVEKKPFYHVYPGTDALTFGMMGCDFHCSYCQNWVTSQALRDPASQAKIQVVTADQLVRTGVRQGCRLVVSSYNEPLITAEWAVAVFQEAVRSGLASAFVSNGNATPEALDFLQPHIVAYKVDLKCFDDQRYRKLGGTLEHVTNTIRMLHDRGIWVEVVTLLISGFNDNQSELTAMAEFLASVSPNIPWHVTAFHPDYKMTEPGHTTVGHLLRAVQIGADAGLNFVYAGNAHGQVGRWENTYCPACRSLLIGRSGFQLLEYHIDREGKCVECGVTVPGVGLGEIAVVGIKRAQTHDRFPRRIRLEK